MKYKNILITSVLVFIVITVSAVPLKSTNISVKQNNTNTFVHQNLSTINTGNLIQIPCKAGYKMVRGKCRMMI